MQGRVAAPAAARVALVAGATGLVGLAVLAALLTDKRYTAVHCVGRRAVPLDHPKLVSHVVDFNALTALTALPGIAHLDDVFIALGTTLKVADSQAAFRAVDFDAVLAVARAALAQPARPAEKFGLLAMRLLHVLIPANYRAITATQVADALLRAVHSTPQGRRVLLSSDMQQAR